MEITIQTEILAAAFAVAVVMGFVAHKTNFCTMGAVSDWVNIGDTGRLRSWVFAMAVATIAVIVMEATSVVSFGVDTFPPYRTAQFAWLRYTLGGLMFGVGMTLGSGCGSKTLIRIGGGNVKSLVVLVVAALCAYLMMWTPFYERVFLPWIGPTTIDLAHYGLPTQELGSIVAGMFGMHPTPLLKLVVAVAAALAMLVFVFRSPDFRGSRDNIVGGLTVGLAVAVGWYLTAGAPGRAWKDYAEMATVVPSRVQAQSYTFISPMGDSVHYLLQPANTSLINFGIAGLVGVVVGSLLYAVTTRKFRVETFASPADFGRHVAGGALMGIGGVLGMGCTIGQGVTGVSTLAIGSLIAFFCMVIGAAVTMKYEYWRMTQEV